MIRPPRTFQPLSFPLRRFFGWLGLVLLAGCTLLPTVGMNRNLLDEKFRSGETGNWTVEADGLGQTLIADEALIIEIYQPQTVQYAALQEPAFSDFVLDVDVTRLAGSANSSYGVLWRLQNDSAFYRFEITGNGLFVIEKKMATGEWIRLSDDWEESKAILKEENQTNRLRIEADGDELVFFINDVHVAALKDSSYTAGRLALSAGTFNQGGLRVAFDNVLVREP